MTPALALARFSRGLILGAQLGILYGFLRPMRRRSAAGADALFLAGTFAAWLQLSFGICGSDIRPGITATLFLGCWGWDRVFGRITAPAYDAFWALTGRIGAVCSLPLKKILQFSKKIFASVKKWVTICWNNCPSTDSCVGGRNHDRTHMANRKGADRRQPQQ